ncbi:MAG: hypothetical protein KAR32_03900 [Candidatus Omnitrophica bacterium]|nr:hypothetical protein [Candidatus Omnitrophota bacterium]MCK5260198.1 hypothetical protein [Candidatus Omnitrophota bacterium]
MKKYVCGLSILFLIFVPVVTECDDSLTRSYSEEMITFLVPIPVEMFSQDAILRVRMWNDEQLERSERNSACVVSYSRQTRTENIRCPEGVEYQAVTPEEFTFSVGEINAILKVKSDMIKVGEKYRLLISGRSNDNCNTTSAEIRDVADNETITIGALSWRTTELACL